MTSINPMMMAKIFRRYERLRKIRSLLGWEQPKKKAL